MSQKNERRAFIVAFLFLLFLCSIGLRFPVAPYPLFTPTPVPVEFQDRSFLTGEPCEAPCWYGLVPGLSTKQQSLEAIQEFSFIDPTTLHETPAGIYDFEAKETRAGSTVEVDCQLPKTEICVTLIFLDGALRNVMVHLKYAVTFEEAISVLGPPDYISAVPDVGARCHISLVLPEAKIILSYNELNSDEAAAELCFDKIPAGETFDTSLPVRSVFYYAQIEEIEMPETGETWQKWHPWLGSNSH